MTPDSGLTLAACATCPFYLHFSIHVARSGDFGVKGVNTHYILTAQSLWRGTFIFGAYAILLHPWNDSEEVLFGILQIYITGQDNGPLHSWL